MIYFYGHVALLDPRGGVHRVGTYFKTSCHPEHNFSLVIREDFALFLWRFIDTFITPFFPPECLCYTLELAAAAAAAAPSTYLFVYISFPKYLISFSLRQGTAY